MHVSVALPADQTLHMSLSQQSLWFWSSNCQVRPTDTVTQSHQCHHFSCPSVMAAFIDRCLEWHDMSMAAVIRLLILPGWCWSPMNHTARVTHTGHVCTHPLAPPTHPPTHPPRGQGAIPYVNATLNSIHHKCVIYSLPTQFLSGTRPGDDFMHFTMGLRGGGGVGTREFSVLTANFNFPN